MFKIGTVYRMPRPHQENSPIVDGLENFYYLANTPNAGFDFQRGIHTVQQITSPSGISRRPLIIISSTPRKAGSEDTPWHDIYDPDHGFVKYYGDNKYNERDQCRPEDAQGNRVLLDLLKYYDSEDPAEREKNAVPVVFFEKCTYDGRAKGNAIFRGFGILESAELVTQYDANHHYFANYVFNFCIFSLSADSEKFDWRWITDRCDNSLEMKDTLSHAPNSWKKWLKEGKESLHVIRRSVSGIGLVGENEQNPKNASLLKNIYNYYGGKQSNTDKKTFEYLAMEVALKTIEENGAQCFPGWVTQASGDGGVDFVMRIDIGHDKLASIKIIVLGQAKCQNPSSPVNGKDIARTVARLKRGWVGAFVTTSYFSKKVQQEVKEDSYPLIMINGAKISEIVERELFESKMTLAEYLNSVELKYKRLVRTPEEILNE